MTSLSKLRFAAILALSGSAVLHVAAMALAPRSEVNVQIEGSQVIEMAALGSSFADLVKQGDTLEPAKPEDDASPTTPDNQVQPVTAHKEARPVEPVKTVAEAMTTTAQSVPLAALAPSPSTSAVASPVPVTNDPESPQPTLMQPVKVDAAAPEPTPVDPTQVTGKIAELSPVKPTEITEPLEEPELKKIPKPVPKPKQVKQPRKKPAKKKPASGQKLANSNADNKAGSQQGKDAKKSAPSGKANPKSKSSAIGNAAASNYPGKVRSQIARTRQKNAGGRGVAIVSFKVTSSGQAASVSVSKSSGNSRIDRAAAAHVKRASPFPKPPPGAQTRFVIPIEFRR